ncbi:Asp-tRNA(Asn)/Glu-tRNA(Gln) amidotransferase subunit GatC [Emticicia sp. CRIBPO]|uniref:Asp-tRNA(Asn)/Glu-tRNA(Gln) amidotransferase subunit GatC n=1 Tax=Emticicia sp. CRIBPO TaxID=2683258 RepID=UPI00141323B4|nr:Asp-tRNA(Asn)/Glu-tRNA(Gln) amidotransferase subunit GatC [Emticicia sp. CRIBPO]NBA87064.1 Asp-tRNA(Asn)/Glu-tRNA(Gln) amidotransferase subunit GatC [Emticicia sp. CRIBPO]
MKIDEGTVQKIAHLSRLELSREDSTKMVEDLSAILDWMEQLNEVDTTGIEPLTHINPDVNVFREDVADNQLSRERGLRNAPLKNEEYFMVPKVIE